MAIAVVPNIKSVIDANSAIIVGRADVTVLDKDSTFFTGITSGGCPVFGVIWIYTLSTVGIVEAIMTYKD